MKRCPSCLRTYADDSLAFCLEDGSNLSSDGSIGSDLPATLIIPDPRSTTPAAPATLRSNVTPINPSPAQAYTAYPPAWFPGVNPPGVPMSTVQQGRGLAITSLICGIAAFVLLGFCILSGAAGVNDQLIGGIFIFSAFIGLLGALLGIVAAVKTGRDVNPRSSKITAVVGLVLNGIYLVIVVVFLILGAVASSS